MSRSVKPEKHHKADNAPGPSSSASPSTSKKDQVYDTLIVGLDVAANVAEGSDILAPLKAACRATKSILEVMQAIENNQAEWTDLTRRLKEFMSALEGQIALFETYSLGERVVDEAFRRPILHYVEFLEETHDVVVNLTTKRKRNKFGVFKSMTKAKVDAEEIHKLNRNIEDRHKQFMEALAIFTAFHVQVVKENINVTKNKVESTQINVEATKAWVEKIVTGVDTSAILQLPMVAFNASSVHSTCLQGTREVVLRTICSWAEDEISQKPIFWLCDIAGSGKSTVAMSVAQMWRKKGIYGGQFFFSLISNEGSTTEKFCSTIARELAQQVPELKPYIAKAVEQNPAIMRSSLQEQLQTLVINPLRQRQQRVILVIDAVDECKSGAQRKELLDTITMAARETNNLKLFITSRPDPVIETVLRPLSIKAELKDRLHDVNHHDNLDDIATYVHQSLGDVLSLEKRQQLTAKASGLFIWASTACRMLTNEATFDTPEVIYERLISVDQAGDIDDVYDLVFQRTDPKSRVTMCSMLALLLAAYEPLTINDLDDLSKHNAVNGNAKALVRNLGSVLLEDPATNLVQFRHPTLVEYLRRRCIAPAADSHHRIYIDLANAHGQAASWCFQRLKSPTEGLKFNICQIESSFNLNREIPDLDARISRLIPRKLRYASPHWPFHVAETNDNWRSKLKKELEYATQCPYVLYWMEVLGLTGGVPRAIAGLRAIARHTGLDVGTASRINEIRRFMIAFAVPIQDSAPHIYLSALAFTPKKSMLHLQSMKQYENTLNVTQGLEETYPGLPNSLRGHKLRVRSVGFSPDGSRIVSGSDDCTIRLWDVDTGQAVGEPLQGHGDGVCAVEFSPDGSRIVSGSHDNTIRFWHVDTGQPDGEPLRGHQNSVWVVAFSPDGSRVVSGSRDWTIRIWDVETGEPVGEPFSGHQGSVNTVGFSPDGSRVVSGSDDRTIRLWDVDTGHPVGKPLLSHTDWIYAVGFSPDGSRIVSGSLDSTIQLWDVETGQAVGEPLRGHLGQVLTAKFSPDGSKIVSGSSDNMIRLWDATTGHSVGEPLCGHRDSVNAVEFSPDGSRIVSGSSDWTIRMWDVETGQPVGEPVPGHGGWVRGVGISPDGSRIVSGSDDKTIRLWDASTGQPVGEPLQGHEEVVWAVTFSPDGSRIVSGSLDSTVRLWDVETGEQVGGPLLGPQDSVWTVRFSPNGSQIVAGFQDSTIQLWDADTREPIGEPLRGHRSAVCAVAFSPDGSLMASGSGDETIRLWDLETSRAVGEPLRGHRDTVCAVAFSPDGSRIASGSEDWTIRLWDVDTGQPLGEPRQGHQGVITSIGFSPDGTRVVSGSYDEAIGLWHVDSGEPVVEFLRGHQARVNGVSFLPDGLRVVSCSGDGTIRLWDARRSDNNSSQHDEESESSSLTGDLGGYYLWIRIPGFKQCSLSHDGWVHSSGKRLFWVPPDNRHGLLHPDLLLTMPTTSSFRATKIDFSRFQCGSSWTNVRTDANA
ncbi:COMPASS-like H3K4 histone methylase component WDR5B {ECO:0000303/PubMed:19567704} Short=AtWDR5B {ECO:0000303/PubMed:19567704} [Serendipita indica DSM 11827]|uniref:Related to WD40-repeat protein (Notchless protein) n=1 Tax=Serendipita indica (strain DSM 11827) TaxID=1109443 RepID=G4THC0_SERID|nr:COMPASS-like H3K4 histone methylase component WDR5B {ECO:0000303/PubMed:19567704} Short=AtWDR5B {ECO:0000303/PubMed:19567704} [Serendipita indica DSM 11827]CCA70723.1 related to WD40-repeat protein (notchless protein) [Serendipita indica DSM 11827]